MPAAVAVPTSPRRSTGRSWLAGQTAITNPALELKLYGADAKNITVYVHEGRPDLWTGLTGSPVAVALKHRNSYLDLTGLARVRAMLRTGNLHVLHPMVRMADGALLAGTRVINTDGQFLMTDVSFSNLRWFTLEPETLAVKGQAMKVDLARVDEVGFVDSRTGWRARLVGVGEHLGDRGARQGCPANAVEQLARLRLARAVSNCPPSGRA